MTTLDPRPSPSRNPFARPKSTAHDGSFSKSSTLPGKASPAKRPSLVTATDDAPCDELRPANGAMVTPADKRLAAKAGGSASAPRTSWRLLWRGGLEIGKEGWRLDGVTFYALISFPPPTPSGSSFNPFAFPTPPASFSPVPSSPFHALPGGTTDLCLSLESMRGRKYLQVRGVVNLPSSEILDGEGEDEGNGGVQMSVAEEAPLLAAYFTNLLCRDGKLSRSGRTMTAVVIGLGDAEVDTTSKSTILVYGQLQEDKTKTAIEGGSLEQPIQPRKLRLLVGRKKPPPPPRSEQKIRPGEPLPRGKSRSAQILFPAESKPFRPFARTFSRSTSNSIYHPPPTTASVVPPRHGPAPISGRTPGRRGEKRARQDGNEDDRKRRAGRIVTGEKERSERSDSVQHRLPEKEKSFVLNEVSFRAPSTGRASVAPSEDADKDGEDIFGRRASSLAPSMSRASSAGGRSVDFGEKAHDDESVAEGSSAKKRARVPQQVLDNKASIRKQTLLLLEERGIPRAHDQFKDLFGFTTKGVYFAFREQLQEISLAKIDIQRIVHGHLDMYLTVPCQAFPVDSGTTSSSAIDDAQNDEANKSGLSFDGRVKLEAVVEEDEA